MSTPLYPDTMDAAVEYLRRTLPRRTLDEIRAMPKKELGQCHFGLGIWIRNNLGLWTTNTALLAATGKKHPDDASMVIIKALWKYLRVNRFKEADR